MCDLSCVILPLLIYRCSFYCSSLHFIFNLHHWCAIPQDTLQMNRLEHIKGHIVSADKNMNIVATLPSPLTTHVLNIGHGVPGANMTISLHHLNPISSEWNLLTTRITNDDGRCPGLISKESFIAGVYKIHFETGKYWDALGETCFYPYVEEMFRHLTPVVFNPGPGDTLLCRGNFVVFTITDPLQKYHVPLLLSRFSYSTYRGS